MKKKHIPKGASVNSVKYLPLSSTVGLKADLLKSEIKSCVNNPSTRAAAAAAARDDALATSLPPTSKGFQMMAKLGFKPGSALGAPSNKNALIEPLGVTVKEDRGGIGMENERKRKFREEVETVEKVQKVEEEGYRERVGREREERRLEALVQAAMRVAEGLEECEGIEGSDGEEISKEIKKTPSKYVNILWRGLVRQRKEKERDRRMRYDLHQSLSKNATYEDPEEDKQDRQALGNEEEEVEEEDPELDEFNALELTERLKRLVIYLREKHRYCFWCKFRYPDEEMEGCPGFEEDDHD